MDCSACNLNIRNNMKIPLSTKAIKDINFIFKNNKDKQLLQGWRKLFYSAKKLIDTNKTKSQILINL